MYFSDHLSCAHLCSRRRVSVGDCNSYSFDNETGSCSLAWLTFLEDPYPGYEAQASLNKYICIDTLTEN